MAFLHLLKLILYLNFLLYKLESKFLGIERLNLEKYFVAFDTGLYIYYNNFANSQQILNIPINDINIIKHINKDNIYIFCLIGNNLYFYDYSKNIMKNSDSFVDYWKLDYLELMPFNTNDNKLNLFIILINFKFSSSYFYCYHYNVNFNDNRYNYIIIQENEKKLDCSLYFTKSLCHLLDSSFSVKCLYYNTNNFLNLEYDIKEQNIKSSFQWNNFNNINLIEFASSKSNEDNYLVCPLFKKKIYISIQKQYFSNYTKCDLCDKNRDFGNCSYINNSYVEDCKQVRTYFFNETNKYGVICKRFNEFIFSIIDHHRTEVINRKIIYLHT